MPGGHLYAYSGSSEIPAAVAPVSGIDIMRVTTNSATPVDIAADARFVSITTDGSGMKQAINLTYPASGGQYWTNRRLTVLLFDRVNASDYVQVQNDGQGSFLVEPGYGTRIGPQYTAYQLNYGGVLLREPGKVCVFELVGDLGSPGNAQWVWLSDESTVNPHNTAMTFEPGRETLISTPDATYGYYKAGEVLIKTGSSYAGAVNGPSIQLNAGNGEGGGGGLYMAGGSYLSGHKGGIVQIQSTYGYMRMYSDTTAPERGILIGTTNPAFAFKIPNLPTVAPAATNAIWNNGGVLHIT